MSVTESASCGNRLGLDIGKGLCPTAKAPISVYIEGGVVRQRLKLPNV